MDPVARPLPAIACTVGSSTVDFAGVVDATSPQHEIAESEAHGPPAAGSAQGLQPERAIAPSAGAAAKATASARAAMRSFIGMER
jgi:hypothetical protein